MMQYKGYYGHVVFDDEHELLHGEVVGIRDVVTFQGNSVDELRKAFQDSVDDYLEFCRQRGESPEKPLSGRFVLRIPPQMHRKISALASTAGQSLNAWIVARLEKEFAESSPPTRAAAKRRPAARNKRDNRRHSVKTSAH
jgi:predicted HicB family RNase H-like nuclease